MVFHHLVSARNSRRTRLFRRSIHEAKGMAMTRWSPEQLRTVWASWLTAAAEHRTVKGILVTWIEERIQDLEKQRLLPKGKGYPHEQAC